MSNPLSGLRLRPVIGGLLSLVPGVAGPLTKGTGNTDSARYCYSIWLRHLVMAYSNGLCRTVPGTVVELGPGDSIGTGLSALLTGTEKYYPLDVVRHDSTEKTLPIFEELVKLFRQREKIPDEKELPKVRPFLESYEFPSHIATEEILNRSLSNDRVKRIEQSIINPRHPSSMVTYAAPFPAPNTIPAESVNMVFSQGALGDVEHLAETYRLMNQWPQPGGFVSHQINLSSHGLAKEWNWHWTCSDLVWKVVRGKRVYYLNREPHSTHIRLLEKSGFRIIVDIRFTDEPGKTPLAPRFAHFSAEDRTTRGVFIQAVKTSAL